jgi:hypothetical protein
MKNRACNITYANVMATLAIFVALGGASYAAVAFPKGSVGSAQLKEEAVTAAKIKDHAVTGAKLRLSTLGTVPDAAHAASADRAGEAEKASEAVKALEATKAANAGRADDAIALGGLPPNLYGGMLTSRTELPATTEDVEWWVGISGSAPPAKKWIEGAMLTPSTGSLYASGLSAFSTQGPGPNDAARVRIGLYWWFDQPVFQGELPLTKNGTSWSPSLEGKVPANSLLAIKVTEEPRGEEIPAIPLLTSVWLSPSPGKVEHASQPPPQLP